MQLDITSRHFTPSEQLKEMVYDKLKKIEKFNSGIMHCRVILTKEANYEDVEIVVNGKGYDFVANENSDNSNSNNSSSNTYIANNNYIVPNNKQTESTNILNIIYKKSKFAPIKNSINQIINKSNSKMDYKKTDKDT